MLCTNVWCRRWQPSVRQVVSDLQSSKSCSARHLKQVFNFFMWSYLLWTSRDLKCGHCRSRGHPLNSGQKSFLSASAVGPDIGLLVEDLWKMAVPGDKREAWENWGCPFLTVVFCCGTGISLHSKANSRKQRVTSSGVSYLGPEEIACRFQASLVSVGNFLRACWTLVVEPMSWWKLGCSKVTTEVAKTWKNTAKIQVVRFWIEWQFGRCRKKITILVGFPKMSWTRLSAMKYMCLLYPSPRMTDFAWSFTRVCKWGFFSGCNIWWMNCRVEDANPTLPQKFKIVAWLSELISGKLKTVLWCSNSLRCYCELMLNN